MKENSLVSIICLCYNHSAFVEEALLSVMEQTYPNIQLIIIDDASSDNSVELIQLMLEPARKKVSEVVFIQNHKNIGNCRAFNKGLKMAKGAYLIDFAADDILLPKRVEIGVKALKEAGTSFGVNFCDVHYINSEGGFIKGHYQRDVSGRLTKEVPAGDVFKEVLSRYYICSPSMMIRMEVMEQLQGYDENLAYEDFDFWVRSSRNFLYCFTDEILVQKRELPNSLGKVQYDKNSAQLVSTYQICHKAKSMIRNDEEKQALVQRVSYEFRQAVLSGNKKCAKNFYNLLQDLNVILPFTRVLLLINFFGINFLKLWKSMDASRSD